MGNSSQTGRYGAEAAVQVDRPLGRERDRRVHDAGSCYLLTCNCGPDDRKEAARRPRAYAYLCRHLLICQPEVTRTRKQLTSYAADTGLELAAIFVEEDWLRLSAFERLFQATILDQVDVVLLPSMLHFAVLGSPRRIKPFFEAVTGARIVTMP